MNNKKLFAIISIVIMSTFIFSACGGNKENNDANIETQESGRDSSKGSSDEENLIVAIVAGDENIYLDEARYYAYTSQATYEVYYLSEKKQIDWNKKVTEKATLEQAVKAETLNKMCKIEALYYEAENYNIELSKEQKVKVKKMALDYFSNSNSKLISKIDISQQRLIELFEKKEIADLVEKAMEIQQPGSSEEFYKQWKSKTSVSTNKQWFDIKFGESIFTEKDL